MQQRVVVAACAAALLALIAVPNAAAAERDPGLDRGIRHVEAGEWKQALVDLSDVVRRLGKDKTRAAEVAEACLYSGLAYVGLGETSPAISQFAQALMRRPQIRIPPERETRAALDAFEVARREAVAPAAARLPGKKSPVPFIAAGAVVVAGAGVAVAAGGGSSSAVRDNPIPPAFAATGATGTPQLLLVSAVPPSSSTIALRQTAPLLTFAFNTEASLPGRVQVFAEMVGLRGHCLTGHSEIAAVDRTAATMMAVVNSWQIICQGGFTTTSMDVRLQGADANIPVSLTTYSGGYIFEQ